jgi:heat shock protein HslJ
MICTGHLLLSAPNNVQNSELTTVGFSVNQLIPLPEQLKNSTFSGFKVHEGPLNLTNGRWEGSPYVEGSASRPSVSLIDGFYLEGNLDKDPLNEVVVFLSESGGGSGEFIYMAILKNLNNELNNIATKLLGDRIQLKEARIIDRHLFIEIVRTGPDDAACCPGELSKQIWEIKSNALTKIEKKEEVTRLSLDDIGGSEWILKSWRYNKDAPSKPEITLMLKDGKFVGGSGCNRYFTPVSRGETPGSISLGFAGSTQMACADSIMKREQHYMSQLAAVNKFGFMNTKLALSYNIEGNPGVMLFEKRKP